MNDPERQLERLVAAARCAGGSPPATTAPPWFARAVVRRWLVGADPVPALSWTRVSHGALACATVIMLLSLAVNFRVVWRRDAPEQIASASVVSLFLPK